MMWSLKLGCVLLFSAISTSMGALGSHPHVIGVVVTILVFLAVAYGIKCNPSVAYTDSMLLGSGVVWTAYSALMLISNTTVDDLEWMQVLRDWVLMFSVAMHGLRYWLMLRRPSCADTWLAAAHRSMVDDRHMLRCTGDDQDIECGGSGTDDDMAVKTRVAMSSTWHHMRVGIISLLYETMFWVHILLCTIPFSNNNLFLESTFLTLGRTICFAVLYILTNGMMVPRRIAVRHVGPTMFLCTTYPLFIDPWMLCACFLHMAALAVYNVVLGERDARRSSLVASHVNSFQESATAPISDGEEFPMAADSYDGDPGVFVTPSSAGRNDALILSAALNNLE